MSRSKVAEAVAVSELEIVDICTKLIFGVDEELSLREKMIVTALRMSDENFASDDGVEMGKYLRALGVREMIKLVALAKKSLDTGQVFVHDRHQGKNLYTH